MTEITKATTDQVQRAKWRAQATRIAELLKATKDWGGKTKIKAGIAFDDQVVTIELPVELIERLNHEALADALFEGVLKVQTDHRAAGESADAQAPGMECGHAAPPVPDGHDAVAGSSPAPAGAAVFERCWRRIAPAYAEQCPNQATGGVQLLLHPHQRFKNRYRGRPMLALILHLPVCADCFAQMTPAQVVAEGLQPGQWGAVSKEAQRRNAGVLPIKENTRIAHVAWADPEYTALRAHIAKHHPEVSQSAPAGPQQEAGNGT